MRQVSNKSTFLIRSSKSSALGTAFCIDQDTNGSFLLTCQHVVEEHEKKDLEVNNLRVEVQKNISSNKLIDLAVLYVKGLEAKPLKLSLHSMRKDMLFRIEGFKRHKAGNQKLEALAGTIKKV